MEIWSKPYWNHFVLSKLLFAKLGSFLLVMWASR